MDFTQQGQTNSLFGNNGQAVQTPALTQLAQILQSMPKMQQSGGGVQPAQSQLSASAPAPYAGQGQNGGAGNPTGLSIPGFVNQASSLQSLPWLTGAQNAGSMGGALAQGATGSAGIGEMVGSALSSLMSLFL